MEHAGESCWDQCNGTQVLLALERCNYCGTDGMCCRDKWVGIECDGTYGGVSEHECVLKPGTDSDKHPVHLYLIFEKSSTDG